jgi:hypothetical protein
MVCTTAKGSLRPWAVLGFKCLWGWSGLIPALEVFDLPAAYQPFNPVFQGQLSGVDFTKSSTRQEPSVELGMRRSIAVSDSAHFSIPVVQPAKCAS